jgi:hypothetical protein
MMRFQTIGLYIVLFIAGSAGVLADQDNSTNAAIDALIARCNQASEDLAGSAQGRRRPDMRSETDLKREVQSCIQDLRRARNAETMKVLRKVTE